MSDDGRLREALRSQARSCESLGSPFMARLCALLAERLQPGTPLTDRLFDWPGDPTSGADSVPLRLAGALHARKLSGDPDLAAVYPPEKADDEDLWQAVSRVLDRHAKELSRFIDSPPQTNEVRRSVALLAAGHWLTAHYPLPVVLSELGASGGLNLMWDRYAVETPQGRLGAPDPVLTLRPEWSGPLPRGPAPEAVERRGVDLNPLRDSMRLRAYLWPDQPERMALTEAALAASGDIVVDRGSAADWLSERLSPRPGHLHVVYNTIAFQYFPATEQSRVRSLLEEAGAGATISTPLAWVSMEGDDAGPGAALTVRLWPGGGRHALARVDFHGRWINWPG